MSRVNRGRLIFVFNTIFACTAAADQRLRQQPGFIASQRLPGSLSGPHRIGSGLANKKIYSPLYFLQANEIMRVSDVF